MDGDEAGAGSFRRGARECGKTKKVIEPRTFGRLTTEGTENTEEKTERSGGARKVPYRAARSNSERAAPSGCVGKRFSAVRLSGINRLDVLGSAAGRGSVSPDACDSARYARLESTTPISVAEDFVDHRRIFNRSDDLQGAAAVGAVFHVDIE